MSKLINIGIFAAIVLVCGMPAAAFARVHHRDAARDFTAASAVSDNELDSMRGGFFNVNGMLVSFSYNAVTAINGIPQNTVSFTDATLAQAVADGKNLQSLISPSVIQNALNGVTITQQRQLDLSISHANLNPHFGAVTAFGNARAFR